MDRKFRVTPGLLQGAMAVSCGISWSGDDSHSAKLCNALTELRVEFTGLRVEFTGHCIALIGAFIAFTGLFVTFTGLRIA